MHSLILTLHVVVCILLIVLILLQSGKEGMGVIFGGGSNTSVFGSTGAGGILVKLTTLMALIFVVTSLSYTYISSPHTTEESTILNVKIEEEAVAPVETVPAEVQKEQPVEQKTETKEAEQTKK